MELSCKSIQVSDQQLDLLWEFLKCNRDIAYSCNRTSQESKRKWSEITGILNSQGLGAYKDWEGWSKYWIAYKAELKIKVAASRSTRSTRTGEGPSSEKYLSDIELKFLHILQDFEQNLKGVKIEPFIETPKPSACIEEYMSLIQEHQNQPVELNEISPDPIPIGSPRQSPQSAALPSARPHRRRRVRRARKPPMSAEAARRALVHSSRIHAEAAVKMAEALEIIAEKISHIASTLSSFERAVNQANSV